MDWPVITTVAAMLPACVSGALLGTALHRHGIRRGAITEED